jgi:hypothetical protein
MAQAIKLTLSGAGIVMAKVPPSIGVGQIVGIVAKPGATDALNVTLYSCPSYSDSAIPAGSTELVSFAAAAAGASQVVDISPDGIDVAGFIAADFADADTSHVVYVFVK